MGLFTLTQMLIYFFVFIQITFTAVLPPRTYNQGGRLSLADSAEWTEYNLQEPEGPGTYSFGYDVEDPETGNVQFRTEERSSNGTVTGSYGYVAMDGTVFVVHYIADHLGYRTKIEQAKVTSQESQGDFYRDSEDASPQMKAAIASLQIQSKRGAEEDQHSRPIDQDNKIMNERKNVAYKVQYYPSLN